MGSGVEQLRQGWKEVNDQVLAAEERLAAAWADFASGKGGPPDKALLDDIARLRRECDAKLTAVLASFPASARTQAEEERPR